MKKNMIRSAAVLAIIAVVFAVIAFVLPVSKNGTFWMALLFGFLAIGFQGYTLWMGFAQGESPRSRFYGFPIAQIGTAYLIVQLIGSLVVILFADWISLTLTLVLFIILLAVAAVGLIAADAMREEIQRQDEKLQKDVSTMRALQSTAKSLASQWNDPDMTKLADDFQYSDPVSAPSLENLESELAATVHELQTAILDGDHAAATALCKKASATLAERNRLCKLRK